MLQKELAGKRFYSVSIGSMSLRLSELKNKDLEAQKFRGAEFATERWEDVDRIFYYQRLFYIPQIICLELISCHNDNLLVEHFKINKIRKLVAKKYYWPTLRRNLKTYVRGCDICLSSKAICHKPYGDLKSLLISINCYIDLSIDFVTSLPVSTN